MVYFFTFKVLQKVISKIIYLNNIEIVRLRQQEPFPSIGSDLALVEARLESLSNSIYLQQGDLTSNKTKTLCKPTF